MIDAGSEPKGAKWSFRAELGRRGEKKQAEEQQGQFDESDDERIDRHIRRMLDRIGGKDLTPLHKPDTAPPKR